MSPPTSRTRFLTAYVTVSGVAGFLLGLMSGYNFWYGS